MEPIKLVLENFCGHSHSEIDFSQFNTALIVGRIRGNDKFSNGAGKSTIFSAIKYVLYNEIEFSTLEKIVRHGCDSCRVSLEFKVSDGNIYKVVRSKSKKVASDLRLFRLNGKWEDLTQRKPSDTEKDLIKVLKINYKTFCNSVLFSQAEILYGLAALTPSVRKAALKDALQLGIYSKLEKLAKEKYNSILKDIEKTRIVISTFGDPEKDVAFFRIQTKEQNTFLAEKQSKKDKIKIEEIELKEKYATLKQQSDIFDQQTSSIRQSVNTLTKEIEKNRTQISEIKNKYKSLLLNKDRIEREIEKLKEPSGDVAKCDRMLEDMQHSINETETSIIDKSGIIKALNMRLKELSVPLPSNAVCPHCRQTMSEEHRISCQRMIDAEVVEIKTQMLSMTEKLSEFKSIEAKNKDRIKFVLKRKQEYIDKSYSLDNKYKEISGIKQLENEYSAIIQNDEQQLATKIKELEKTSVALSSFNIEELDKIKKQLQQYNSDIAQKEEAITAHQKEITNISNSLAILSHKISERTDDLKKVEELSQNLRDLEQKYVMHAQVIQAFGPSGIPALITHTILDDFQIEANNLLTQLKPGLQTKFTVIKDRSKGETDDTLDISYILNGQELEYAQLSGAQKLIASLCLKLGLSEVIKKRIGVDIRILLIDEIDSALDDGGLEAFQDAIKKLQNDYKILIITHNRELKDQFVNKIVVEQDENFVSTARVSND